MAFINTVSDWKQTVNKQFARMKVYRGRRRKGGLLMQKKDFYCGIAAVSLDSATIRHNCIFFALLHTISACFIWIWRPFNYNKSTR